MSRIVGYARVSTDDQTTIGQADELKAAGCTEIVTEHASGADRSRPVLARALGSLAAGDTLVVVRIDRLARSLSHLLEVIEKIGSKKAFFRSLRDPIDTSSPQGMFALQVLGAAGQLERALIRERTLSGLAAARKRGRVGGNPGMRRGDKEAIAKIISARRRTRLASLQALEREWLPHIKKMRPIYPWQDVLDAVLAAKPSRRWTLKSLISAARLYCQEGFLDTGIFKAAALRRRKPQSRAFEAIVGMKLGDAKITLAEIAAALTKGKFLTPTSQRIWTVSSVQKLVEKARRTGRL